jgi:hypothetical protein
MEKKHLDDALIVRVDAQNVGRPGRRWGQRAPDGVGKQAAPLRSSFSALSVAGGG